MEHTQLIKSQDLCLTDPAVRTTVEAPDPHGPRTGGPRQGSMGYVLTGDTCVVISHADAHEQRHTPW